MGLHSKTIIETEILVAEELNDQESIYHWIKYEKILKTKGYDKSCNKII